jgi:hypothetical protein
LSAPGAQAIRKGPDAAQDLPPLSLSSAADLARFLRSGRWLRSHAEIVLRLPEIERIARRRIERRLDFWGRVCGCIPGTLAVLAAIVWCVLAAPPDWQPAMLLTDAAIVLAAGVAGKLASLTLARLALATEVALLWRRARRREGRN